MENQIYDYDLIVIGGGSGGMAAAKQAASLGARVVLFDYVKPSTQGTKWGLGGTCVNVGCVPKKLMHYAGLLGEGFHDAKELGWVLKDDETKHDWNKLVETVSNHVHMLNFRYRNALRFKDVNYINALAEIVDKHTVSYVEKNQVKQLTAKAIVISVGGRPYLPTEVDGALEHAITSDDIFTLKRAPGKTLCIGGSYISLECAGFLLGLGYDVSIAVRSVLLRGFDRQAAEKIGQNLSELGARFYYDTVVTAIDKTPRGKYQVTFYQPTDGSERMELFDTVLFATGRQPDLSAFKKASSDLGVNINQKNGKLIVNKFNQTSVDSIYAIGDVCDGSPELTPVAIREGELLATRLFSPNTKEHNKFIDYKLIPTTVFTPTEYGSIGYSEEEAIEKFGKENIEIYLSEFTTLELSAVHRLKKRRNDLTDSLSDAIVKEEEDQRYADAMEEDGMSANCLAKLVCLKTENEKVIGFHFVGPNAGEITQGFALAVKLGATKEDFDDLISIHPTDAESFCALSTTKSSGKSWVAEGGCGGGVCG